jgi:hypothetical protein
MKKHSRQGDGSKSRAPDRIHKTDLVRHFFEDKLDKDDANKDSYFFVNERLKSKKNLKLRGSDSKLNDLTSHQAHAVYELVKKYR